MRADELKRMDQKWAALPRYVAGIDEEMAAVVVFVDVSCCACPRRCHSGGPGVREVDDSVRQRTMVAVASSVSS